MKVKSENEVAQSTPTLSDSWTAAYQAPQSMGFSRQEYWSEVPLPSLSVSTGLTNSEVETANDKELPKLLYNIQLSQVLRRKN